MKLARFIVLLVFVSILVVFVVCKTTEKAVKQDNLSDEIITKEIDKDKLSDQELRDTIEALFNALERRIAQSNFESWFSSISRSYKYYLSDPNNLDRIGRESDFLFNRNIKLKGARDYFMYVVVQSREGRSLKYDGFDYIDKYHIKVFCEFDKNDKFVYDFIYEDDSWKIDR
jgi:hypothetical protein